MNSNANVTRHTLEFTPLIIFEIVLVAGIIAGYTLWGWLGAFLASWLILLMIHFLAFMLIGKGVTVFVGGVLIIDGLINSLLSEVYYPTHSEQFIVVKFIFFTPIAVYLTLVVSLFAIFLFASIRSRREL